MPCDGSRPADRFVHSWIAFPTFTVILFFGIIIGNINIIIVVLTAGPVGLDTLTP